MATYDRFAGIDDNYLFPPEVMTAISGGSAFSTKYYTKTQTNSILDEKSDVDHNHDSRYYTQAQTDQKVAGIFTPIDLGTTINLNDATVVGAEYIQSANTNATTGRNYPIAEAGNLNVLPYSAANADRVIQRYSTFQSLRLFQRSRFNGVWSAWEELGVQKDTGDRDLTSLVPEVTAGHWTVRRIGNWVYMNLYDLGLTATAGDFWQKSGFLPVGIRPVGTSQYVHFTCAQRNTSGFTPGPFRVDRYGGVTVYGVTGKLAAVTASWITNDAFPTTLPGTPA